MTDWIAKTATGSIYKNDGGSLFIRDDDNEDKLVMTEFSLRNIDPRLADSWDSMNWAYIAGLDPNERPEKGKLMFLSCDNTWRFSSLVVEVDTL